MADETDTPQGAPAEGEQPEAAEVAQQPEATAGTDEADILDGDEITADPEAEPKKPAKGVQKRLDELTRRIHEERREKERLLAILERGNQPQGQPAAQPAAPRVEDYASYDDYENARIEYAVEQRLQTARVLEQRQRSADTFKERVDAVRDRLPDYDIYVGDPTLTITPLMAEVIRESEVGPEVAYHLGKNRSEATRIANLPPHRQAAELGRLEATLSIQRESKPSPKPLPPAPPKTVTGLSAGLNKPLEDMSMAEYVAQAKAEGRI